MKAKIALVSALLFFAAAAAIAFHFHNRAGHGASARTTTVAATTAAKPTPAPTVAAPKNSSPHDSAQKPAAAKETPKPTPTPTATPEGPMREIRVAVIWEDTQRAVEGTTVSMQMFAATDNLYPKVAKTNAEGIAVVKIPESWAKARLRCQHADSMQNAYKPFEPATIEQPIMMTLKRGGRAYGIVKLIDGSPAAGAEVQAWNAEQLRRAHTANDGSFEVCQLPPGDTRFISILKNLRSDIKNPKGLTYRTNVGQKVGPVVLTLEPGLSVSGVVTAAKTGQPVPGATVTVPNDSRVQKVKVMTDLVGRFTVEGLPQARVTMIAKADNFAGQARLVQLAPGTNTKCDFALNPGAQVEATVVDQKGNPIEGASLSVNYERNYQLSEGSSVKTDSSGRALLKNLSADDGVNVSASKTETGSDYQRVNFAPGELKATVKLTLKQNENENKPGYIAGTVSDENGKPLPNINLYYGYMQSSSTLRPSTKTDANGKYEIETRSNQYYLTAYANGWGTEVKNSVSPGKKENPTKADFTMKPGHYLAGLVVDEKQSPLPAVRISLTGYNGGGQMPGGDVKTDASGKFRVENLPDMKFNVSFSGDDIPSQYQTGSVDTENKFVLKPVGTIKGKVLEKETKKPVEAFTIKIAGDSIDYSLRTTGQAFSSSDGRFEIKQLKKDDSYDLMVDSKGFSTHTESKVVAKAADATDEITVYVSKGDAMRGILIDAKTNTPVAGAVLVYGSTTQQGWFSWRMLTERGYDYAMRVVSRAVTGLDGRFELSVDDSHQTLYILPREHMRMILGESDLAKYKRDKEYIITVAPGATITGKLLLDGKIQPSSQVYLNQSRSQQSGQSVDYGDIKSNDQGVYALSGLEAGEYSLSGPLRHVGNYGYMAYAKRTTLKEGETKEVNLGDNLGQCLLAGAVLNSGQPVSGAQINLSPQFEWDYTSISGNSDDNGVYTIDGLVPGKYNANVYKMDDRSGMNRFQINEVIEIKGASTEHNFEKGGHKVTGRLVFEDQTAQAQRTSFRNGQLNVTNYSQQTEAGPRIDQYANCDIKNGVLTFEGQFKGEYRIQITGDYQSGNMSSMALPQKFQIDNTQGDVDLGDIVVPASGRIKINVRNTDPSVKLRYVMAIVKPAGGAANDQRAPSNNLQIDPNKGEQSVGPVPAGDVQVSIMSEGCRCDPPSQTVTVAAGQEAGPLNFTLIPSSDIMVIVMGANTNLQTRPAAIPGSRVTLSGSGIQRSLSATDAPLNEQTAMAAYSSNKDMTFGPVFIFRNLPEGSYTLNVNAPGYKPFSQQATAAKGKTGQIQVKLLKQ